MKPSVMREARTFRLELMLLGMALAVEGDREKILDEISSSDLGSELVADCLEAIRTKEPNDIDRMKAILKNWGLPVKGRVIDSLLEAVKVNRARREFEEACFELNHCSVDNVDAFRRKADKCYDSLVSSLGESDAKGDEG